MTRSETAPRMHPKARPRQKTAPKRGHLWLWLAASGLLGAIVVVYLVLGGGGSTPVNAETRALAATNAGTDIRVLTGSHHTVYHSTAPLPSRDAPRADGELTLVWFSGTWCEFCERMEPWAHQTAAQFSDRLVFVEKSVDHDRDAASRYGVRGTPTFVLIDATGKAIAQFAYQPSPEAFKATIDRALGKAPRV